LREPFLLASDGIRRFGAKLQDLRGLRRRWNLRADAETVGLFSVLSADAADELQWWRGTVRRQAAAAAPGISLAWSKLVTPSGLGGTFQRFCGRRGATPPASGFFDAPALLVRLTVVGRGC
jgi:hypothetical protein